MDGRERRFRLVPPGSGRSFPVLGDTVVSVLGGEETGGAFAVVLQISPPGGGTPLHVHHREDECFYVLEGEYEFQVGDQTVRASAGTFLFVPRDVPHRLRCLGQTPGKLQVTITPAGFERLFEEIGLLDPGGRPAEDEMMALAKAFGLELLGPPPEPWS